MKPRRSGHSKQESRLSAAHQKLLSDSAIAPDVARERGYKSTNGNLRHLRFAPNQCRTGLLIPIWGGGQDYWLRLRPDDPRKDEHGKIIKYETPRGSRMTLDIHPRMREKLGDPKVDLFILGSAEGGRRNLKGAMHHRPAWRVELAWPE